MAFAALIRTFLANADQRFIDRFGITLLVSLLAGAALAIPAYGMAMAYFSWRRPRLHWSESAVAKQIKSGGPEALASARAD